MLTGTQKAAVVLMQLGKERAARIMSRLEEQEIEDLTSEIMRMERVEQSMADQVIEEFYDATSIGPALGGGMPLPSTCSRRPWAPSAPAR